MFIVWTESLDGIITAETKATKLAAVRAYNKLSGVYRPDVKTFGWSEAKTAQPSVRVAAGLPAFPKAIFA